MAAAAFGSGFTLLPVDTPCLRISDVKQTPSNRANGSSHSRSTSAGSDITSKESGSPPVQFPVRNTFIDCPAPRALSLEGFLQPRGVHSCPASRPVSFDECGAPPGLESYVESVLGSRQKAATVQDIVLNDYLTESGSADGEIPLASPPPRWATFDGDDFPGLANLLEGMEVAQPMTAQSCHWTMPGNENFSVSVADSFRELDFGIQMPCEASARIPPPPPSERAPRLEQSAIPPPPLEQALDLHALCPAWSPTVFPLSASELGSRVVPSPELPTLGSTGHQSGQCKPCAFLHTRGCTNGAACSFCHLCPMGEKKRRQREKKAFRRMAN